MTRTIIRIMTEIMTAKTLTSIAVLIVSADLLIAGCSGGSSETSQAANSADGEQTSQADQVIERVSELGPVKATVKLAPKEPKLGDPITLTLEVEAESGVTVEMPAFGEALGRFQITQYAPVGETARDSKYVSSQVYTLQAPMSGRQRIPPLRIEFIDERPGQKADSSGDPAAKELLTDEIAVVIASVLPEGQVADLLGPPADKLELPSAWRFWAVLSGVIFGLLALGTAAVVVIRNTVRAARFKARISAYDVAMARLVKLEDRGLPSAENLDDWYVELSSIIRHYLEDRYSLRAPELTTEEFLQIAQLSGRISASHREFLSVFLNACDRVKFARYEPGQDESQQSIGSARRFLNETRLLPISSGQAKSSKGESSTESKGESSTTAGA